MKIVMTVNAAWNIWNFRLPLVTALLAEGHEVTVLAPRDEVAERLEALGCRFVHLQMDVKGLNPVQDARLWLRMRRHFRQIRPDVILSFTIKNNLFGALAAKSLGIAFVPNVTGLGTAFLSGRMLERVATLLYRRAFAGLGAVFFQNEDDRDLFLSRGLVRAGQARLLPGSGIDLERFAAQPYPAHDAGEGAGETVFLLIARLLRDKGIVEYADAARQVRAAHPGARFQILGALDAQNRSAIDPATVEGWVAEGAVEYLGTTEDVQPVIAAAHCVVLPSYREGAPRTLIEAAALARPLIATDVPGCRAVVDADISGFLCAAQSADSLASACLRFLQLSAAARAEMGRAARHKMEREFDQRIVVAAYRDVLTGLGAA